MEASAAEVTLEPEATADGRGGRRPSSGDSLRRFNGLPLYHSKTKSLKNETEHSLPLGIICGWRRVLAAGGFARVQKRALRPRIKATYLRKAHAMRCGSRR
jgi:hypothetical protein